MKYCCLIVFIFCTIDVSNGGILSGICNASNGTCGKKGVPCTQTFGSEWTNTGKCCNERPCCKFLKPQCVPETCPEGYRLLPNQDSSTSCYLYGDSKPWEEAKSICASTPGAYLWRPNTEQEANYVYQEFIFPYAHILWTGANDRDGDGTYTFYKENGPFSIDLLPFGSGGSSFSADDAYVTIQYKFSIFSSLWLWSSSNNFVSNRYICEYQRRVCP
ncbi:Hypothetical predicted protein [Mytilus galloprovincialis]|nr:Hypothetical predicted protein [Mytilus galloprovincialis]